MTIEEIIAMVINKNENELQYKNNNSNFHYMNYIYSIRTSISK